MKKQLKIKINLQPLTVKGLEQYLFKKILLTDMYHRENLIIELNIFRTNPSATVCLNVANTTLKEIICAYSTKSSTEVDILMMIKSLSGVLWID